MGKPCCTRTTHRANAAYSLGARPAQSTGRVHDQGTRDRTTHETGTQAVWGNPLIKPPINEGDTVQVVNGKYTLTGTVLGFTPVFKGAAKTGEPTGWLITVRCECCGVCESWPEKQVRRSIKA